MKFISGLSLFVFFTILSFPAASDAFSRRSHQSEMAPQSSPMNTSTTRGASGDVSAAAVPEPPVLLLMSLGVGLLGIGALVKRMRLPHGSPDQED